MGKKRNEKNKIHRRHENEKSDKNNYALTR